MRVILIGVAIAALDVGCNGRGSDARKETALSSDKVYQNPVDKKTYVAPGGWKKYHPQAPRPEEPGKKVKHEEIRLLTSQRDIAERTTVEELATFIKEVERVAEQSLGTSGTGFKLLAQFDCTPSGHEVRLAHQGEAAQNILQGFYNALKGMKKLPVKGGTVSFQVEMAVSP
jgi:hypothetical protein